MEIRSYRRVFDLERRVYSVDRLRLNPSGVPVRGVAYFVAVVITVLVGSSLPLLAQGIDLVPWYLRDLLLPALVATFMALIRVEGRTFHHAAHALLRFACSRRRLVGGWRPCAGSALVPGRRARFARWLGATLAPAVLQRSRGDPRRGISRAAGLAAGPRSWLEAERPSSRQWSSAATKARMRLPGHR